MPVPAVIAIDGVIRHYAWGSRTAIPELLGIEPDGEPAAELWFGAHPDDPSQVPAYGTTLDALLAAEPGRLLGAATVQRFGPRLPFLVKMLAVETALSIQVHPTLEQAQAGFAAEDAAGVARAAPQRNYRDPNHKPELLCAMTPFTALCGFRSPAQIIGLIDDLPVAVGVALAGVRTDLLAGDKSAALCAAFSRLVSLGERERELLADAVVSACRRVLPRHAPLAAWAEGPIGAARVVDLCAHDFPGDVGAVLSLLLNPVVLQPGEAIYLGAGTVHSYLRGTGVEIMANSDNVLRCGLTPKHVDVPEVLKITDFAALTEPRCPAEDSGCGPSFATPAPDFALSLLDLDAHQGSLAVDTLGPHIVLCTEGQVRVGSSDGSIELTPGHAAFVAARAEAFGIRGTGRVHVATVGALG